jgi:hypothetical protein
MNKIHLAFAFVLFTAGLAQGAAPCKQGYVWREAFQGDFACVTPESRAQAANDNGQARARIDPVNQSYGPDTCIQGYVWRQANPRDHVCVTPATRSRSAEENRLSASRTRSQRID